MLQWSRRLSATETARQAREQLGWTQASMEPSPLSDGDPPCSATTRAAGSGFNGAVASQRRRPIGPFVDDGQLTASMEPSPLSDGDSTAAHAPLGSVSASMEPSPLSDGDRVPA